MDLLELNAQIIWHKKEVKKEVKKTKERCTKLYEIIMKRWTDRQTEVGKIFDIAINFVMSFALVKMLSLHCYNL